MIFVLLTHALIMLDGDSMLRVYLGVIGNGIFFFISGYLAIYNNKNSGLSFWSFLSRRTGRIYPLYWIGLALFLGSSYWINQTWDWPTVIINFLGLQVLTTPLFTQFISLYWFVSAILLCYAVYPFITQKGSLSTIILRSILVFGILALVRITTQLVLSSFFEYFLFFVLGILSARAKIFDTASFKTYGLALYFVLAALVGVVLVFEPVMPGYLARISLQTMINFGMVTLIRIAIVFTISAGIYWACARLEWPAFLKKVIISGSFAAFCVYLLHPSIYILMEQLFRPPNINIDGLILLAASPFIFPVGFYLQRFVDGLPIFRRTN